MGIDLELADCAAAHRRWDECAASGEVCRHRPDCAAEDARLMAAAAAERPGEGEYTSSFRYRHFEDINDIMRATGMGYPATPAADPGGTGIPAHKLLSNDRWLVTPAEIDEALAAYARLPADRRAALEAGRKWACWLDWLSVARRHGGFEAE